MRLFVEALVAIRGFLEAGGDVLWAIFAVTALMWMFIIERLWYLDKLLPQRVASAQKAWQEIRPETTWQIRAIRKQLISEISIDARRYLPLIRALMAVLPLLGLLGTVSGMIQVFDAVAISGAGSARLMASGVSAATIPTMSGLVAALSGLYLTTYLDQRTTSEVKRAEDLLVH